MAARLPLDKMRGPQIHQARPLILTPGACPRRARAARLSDSAAAAAAVAAPPPPATVAPPPPASLPPPPPRTSAPTTTTTGGHSALLHGLGDVGDVPATHMPALLRAAHSAERRRGRQARRRQAADDAPSTHPSQPPLLPEFARGYCQWRAALAEGLLPPCADEHLSIAAAAAGGGGAAASAADDNDTDLVWPAEPLRTTLVRAMAKLGVARLAGKYPAVREALLRSVLDATAAYEQRALELLRESGELGAEDGEEGEEEENGSTADNADANNDPEQQQQKYKTAAELAAEDLERRARRAAAARSLGAATTEAEDAALAALRGRDSAALRAAKKAAKRDARLAALGPERRAAVEVARALYEQWEPAATALDRAGRAFEGLEALLGGEGFGVTGDAARMWRREGWTALDELRRKLERLKELRDLVRSLGRGGGWGPLR